MLGKSEAGPKLQGLPEVGDESLREPLKQSKLVLKNQGRREGRCHTKSSCLGGEPCAEHRNGDEQSQAANTQIRKKHLLEQRSWETDGTFRRTENHPSKTSAKHTTMVVHRVVQEIQLQFWGSFLSLEPLGCMSFFSS